MLESAVRIVTRLLAWRIVRFTFLDLQYVARYNGEAWRASWPHSAVTNRQDHLARCEPRFVFLRVNELSR